MGMKRIITLLTLLITPSFLFSQINKNIDGWNGIKWNEHIELNNDSLFNINGLYFNLDIKIDSNKLKSVYLKNTSRKSNIRSIVSYFNNEYCDYYKDGDSYRWDSEYGSIIITELCDIESVIKYGADYEISIEVSPNNQNYKLTLNDLRNNQIDIQYNLYKSHVRFRSGTITILSGISVNIIGTALVYNNLLPTKQLMPMLIFGTTLSTIGTVMVIDSHKFIGRASLSGIKIDIKSRKPVYNKIYERSNN